MKQSRTKLSYEGDLLSLLLSSLQILQLKFFYFIALIFSICFFNYLLLFCLFINKTLFSLDNVRETLAFASFAASSSSI